MRFLHMADVHLGNQQYNIPRRFDDFGRAFLRAVDLAVAQEVDACVIAGDLFHKSSVDPNTLLQAEAGLARLQASGIAAVAVHGNHDNVRYRVQVSWLDYLAERGLLALLSPDFNRSPLGLVPWDEEDRWGSYLDIDGTRFIGVPWLGASAPRILAEVAAACGELGWEGICFTVLVTHAGVEGQMPHLPGGLRFAELSPLKGRVQYLALGHLHKPYEVEDWIYNPGSLETCSFDEEQYERGVYLVNVQPDGSHTAEHLKTIMRPFVSLYVQSDRCPTPSDLADEALACVRHEKRRINRLVSSHPEPAHALPVVRLVLQGNLSFDRTQLDLGALRALVADEIEALLVRIENRTRPLGVEVALEEGLNRQELEHRIFGALVQSDTRFSAHADVWTTIMSQIKDMVLEAGTPEEIFTLLDRQMTALEEVGDVDY